MKTRVTLKSMDAYSYKLPIIPRVLYRKSMVFFLLCPDSNHQRIHEVLAKDYIAQITVKSFKQRFRLEETNLYRQKTF